MEAIFGSWVLNDGVMVCAKFRGERLILSTRNDLFKVEPAVSARGHVFHLKSYCGEFFFNFRAKPIVSKLLAKACRMFVFNV